MGTDRLASHGVPLSPGRKGSASPPHQLGIGDLADHAFGPEFQRNPKRFVPTVRPVVIEAGRPGSVDPSKQPKRRIAGLRKTGVGLGGWSQVSIKYPSGFGRVEMAEQALDRLRASHREQGRGRLVAEAQTRTPQPDGIGFRDRDVVALGPVMIGGADGLFQLLAQLCRPFALAGDVIADVEHPFGPGHGREQGVKRDHPVRLRRRD